MKNKTKKFTVIIAAIFIAALCVFSITFRNGGGVSAHAAASAGVQEQATQLSVPEETTETVVVFSEENSITKENFSKAESWLSGKDFDGFKLEIQSDYISLRRDDIDNTTGYPIFSTQRPDNGYDYGFFIYRSTMRFENMSPVFDVESLVDIKMTQSLDNIKTWNIEITEDKLLLYVINNDDTKSLEKNFAANTTEYIELKKYLISNKVKADHSDARAIEKITLYKYEHVGPEVPLPEEPTREGYTFAGWYYGADTDHGENCTAYNGEQITAETKLHAHFNINRYTVTFDTVGGKEIANQVVDWGTELTPPTPEKTGHDFKGWYLSDGTEYTGQPIKEDTTLIAQWQIKILTVTFYVGGEVYVVKEVEYGTRFVEVIEEAATENLELLTVLEGETEKKINKYLNVEITDNYDVTAVKIKADPTSAQIFFGKYPWIFAASGAGLALTVALIGVAGYFAQKQSVQSTGRKKR